MKGQAGVEYLIIISVALLILFPLIYNANKLLIAYEDENKISSAKNAVKKLGENADWVFSQGSPAKITIEVYIPKGIDEISIDNSTISFKVKTSSGVSDVFYETIAPLNGVIQSKSGYYFISLTAHESYVNVEVV